jgi:hypothetical protein
MNVGSFLRFYRAIRGTRGAFLCLSLRATVRRAECSSLLPSDLVRRLRGPHCGSFEAEQPALSVSSRIPSLQFGKVQYYGHASDSAT